MTTVPRELQALVEKWRKEEADYKRQASGHAAYGGHLYTRYMAKWELAQRYVAELESALTSLPPADGGGLREALEAHIAWLRISADDIKARGYLEAWNERQVCANELEQLLASPRPAGEER